MRQAVTVRKEVWLSDGSYFSEDVIAWLYRSNPDPPPTSLSAMVTAIRRACVASLEQAAPPTAPGAELERSLQARPLASGRSCHPVSAPPSCASGEDVGAQRRPATSSTSGPQLPVQTGRFGVALVTISGQQLQLTDLGPDVSLAALRREAAAKLGWPPQLLHLCLGSAALSSAGDGDKRTLGELGIREGTLVTCLRAQGVALGCNRYALTRRSFHSTEDLPAAVREEFGDSATMADFQVVGQATRPELATFMDTLGLYGSAFVVNGGWSNFQDDSGGHFFVCRHSGNIPAHWLAPRPNPVPSEDCGINAVDLCWKAAAVMPVLVDLGPP